MAFYSNWHGSSQTLPKPKKPFKIDSRIYSRIYLHNGESTESFKWTASRLNFMSEMMKLFPGFEAAGYAGADSATFADKMHEYGQGEGSPFFEGNNPPAPGTYEYDDYTSKPIHPMYNDPWDDNATKPNHGYTRDHFGSDHRAPDPRTGLPWGFFQGTTARNINFYQSVGEFNHFKITGENKYIGYDRPAYNLAKTTSEGWDIEDALSASAYDGLFFSGIGNYSDIWNSGKTLGNLNVLSGGVKNTLNLYGDMNYYDIVMSGLKNGAQVKYGDLGQAGVVDGEKVGWAADNDWDLSNSNGGLDFYNGAFAYDGMQGANGEGAFKLMLGLLESRRRIFFASYEIFGPTANIGDKNGNVPAPNDQEMINAFNAWKSDPGRGGGADPHNLSLFSLFLYAQHSLHSIMPLYSIPSGYDNLNPSSASGGLPGWMFSGKDQLAFSRFGQWMRTNLDAYKNYLNGLNESQYQGLGDYRNTVSNLVDEFYGEGAYTSQPYVNTKADEAGVDGVRAGWDQYSLGWSAGNEPTNANPRSTETAHAYYVVSQLMGINIATDRVGNVYDANGVLLESNLGSRNWAVHHVLNLLKTTDQDVGQILSIRVQNRRNSAKYREEMEQYHETKLELVREEQRDEAMAKKRSAEHKQNMARLEAQKKQENDHLKMARSGAIKSKISQKMLEQKSQERRSQQGRKKK